MACLTESVNSPFDPFDFFPSEHEEEEKQISDPVQESVQSVSSPVFQEIADLPPDQPNLKFLCVFPSKNLLAAIADRFAHLEALKFIGLPLDGINDSEGLQDQDFVRLTQKQPGLRTLSIPYFQSLSEGGLIQGINHLSQLEKFEIFASISQAALSHIIASRTQHLRTLKLGGGAPSDNESLKAIKKLTNLTSLAFQFYDPKFTDEGISDFIKPFPQLRKLVFGGLMPQDGLTSEETETLVKNNPQLTKLYLYGCLALRVEVLDTIAKHCLEIERLSFTDCENPEAFEARVRQLKAEGAFPKLIYSHFSAPVE